MHPIPAGQMETKRRACCWDRRRRLSIERQGRRNDKHKLKQRKFLHGFDLLVLESKKAILDMYARRARGSWHGEAPTKLCFEHRPEPRIEELYEMLGRKFTTIVICKRQAVPFWEGSNLHDLNEYLYGKEDIGVRQVSRNS